MRSAGNASIAVLILVFALSAIFLSAAAFSGALAKLLMGLSADDDEKALLEAEAHKTIELLSRDPTPEADSRLDPVWAEIALPAAPGVTITLTDLSSRINPNSALDYLLASVNSYQDGKPYEEFHKFRTEKGPLSDMSRTCADYFKEELFTKFFTEYSFFNVNTANESMLYLMFETRSGKKATSLPFASKVRNQRTNKKFFTNKDMSALLSTDADAVYPFICALPEMNVNLMDPDLLGAVLTMAKNIFKVQLNGAPRDAILAMREGTEITAENLAALIQPKFKNTILEQYLGCRTWFWEISVRRGPAVYRTVVMRVPAPPGEQDKGLRLRLLEATFEKTAPGTGASETEITDE
jgi:hypothetical protein